MSLNQQTLNKLTMENFHLKVEMETMNARISALENLVADLEEFLTGSPRFSPHTPSPRDPNNSPRVKSPHISPRTAHKGPPSRKQSQIFKLPPPPIYENGNGNLSPHDPSNSPRIVKSPRVSPRVSPHVSPHVSPRTAHKGPPSRKQSQIFELPPQRIYDKIENPL